MEPLQQPPHRPGSITGLSDTDPKAEEVRIELIRAASMLRRMELACQIREAVLALAMSGLARRHPADSPAQLRRRLADLVLGESLAAAAYGEYPSAE